MSLQLVSLLRDCSVVFVVASAEFGGDNETERLVLDGVCELLEVVVLLLLIGLLVCVVFELVLTLLILLSFDSWFFNLM